MRNPENLWQKEERDDGETGKQNVNHTHIDIRKIEAKRHVSWNPIQEFQDGVTGSVDRHTGDCLR